MLARRRVSFKFRSLPPRKPCDAGVRCELPKPAGQHAQECMVMAGEGGEGQDTLL